MIKNILKKGKELSKVELDIINKARKEAFNSKRMIDPKKGDDEWNKDFFLVKNEGKFVAMGCLENVNVSCDGLDVNVLGISRIIAIEEGKGFGRAVMNAIKEYLIQQNKIGLGFCNVCKSGFYKKCGFDIMADAQNNFVYYDENGEIVPPEHPTGDVVIWDKYSKLLKLWETDQGITFVISKPHW